MALSFSLTANSLLGKNYQYICGRTDIQAAHMMGFHQPEGKCVLFINATGRTPI